MDIQSAMSNEPIDSCTLCGGSRELDQRGILRTYVLSCPVAFAAILAGLAFAAYHSVHWLWLALAGYILPLANADLRILLFPYVSLSRFCGRRVNCPRCEPTAGIFRRGKVRE